MLLSDQQLVELDQNIIKGLNRSGDLFAADSRIQPASIDLTIGDIFLPEVKQDDEGGSQKSLAYHPLDAGHTAIVQTLEELDFPRDLAAIGFPPTTVSTRGLLMTNPGHVDPGYKGRMKFTVINMARESYPLRRGDIIVTLLFFRLNPPAKKSYSERYSTIQSNVTEEQLSKLAKDFLNFERRTEDIARDIAKKSERMSVLIGIGLPIAIVLLAGILNSYFLYQPTVSRTYELGKQMTESHNALEKEINSIKDRLERFRWEKRIEELEALVKKGK